MAWKHSIENVRPIGIESRAAMTIKCVFFYSLNSRPYVRLRVCFETHSTSFAFFLSLSYDFASADCCWFCFQNDDVARMFDLARLVGMGAINVK